MEIVLLTALGVGGATIFGSLIGFVFKGVSDKFGDIVLAFAAGVMLAASAIGLILPSLEYGGDYGIVTTVLGMFSGAFLLVLIDKFIPHPKTPVKASEGGCKASRAEGVMLFVLAIGIHNLPEGIAAGVGFGTGDNVRALIIAGGIALQNIPEGMIIIAPMLSVGIKPLRTFFYAALTGAVEILGTLVGYFAVSVSVAVLPFALAFAGGTMLYVISEEMIPSACSQNGKAGAFALLFGFCAMLVFDALLG